MTHDKLIEDAARAIMTTMNGGPIPDEQWVASFVGDDRDTALSWATAALAPALAMLGQARSTLAVALDTLEIALEPWDGAAKQNGLEFIAKQRVALAQEQTQ